MIGESEYCSKSIEGEFNTKLFVINKLGCWICKNAYKEGEVEVKDHNR